MPELPEVETIRRGLEPLLGKRKILEVIVLTEKSFQGEKGVVIGASVLGVRRRGKALLIDLDNGRTMMVHLRMTGQMIWRGEGGDYAGGHPNKNFIDELPNGQTRVIFVFKEGKLFFNDQRKFGFVKVMKTSEVEKDTFIAQLAKEPWEMTGEELYKKCVQHKNALIKAVLLDQKIIAGLGNIYADEALFYAEVHPARRAGTLTEREVEKILEGAREVMEASIDSGGSTMATYIKPDGTTGDYLEMFAQVFRREGKACNRCGETILKTKVAGRGTHYCPHCQVAPVGWEDEGLQRAQRAYMKDLMPRKQ